MKRYLGIDYGTKRIGLAIGDDDSRIASPLETVAARSGLKLLPPLAWDVDGRISPFCFR